MAELTAIDQLKALENDSQGTIGEIKKIIDAIVRKWQWCDVESVDDMAQDCFLKVLQNVRKGSFKGESTLKTYIYAIARNTCLDYYQQRKTAEITDIEQFDFADETPNAEEKLRERNRRRLACRILQNLPPQCRDLWRSIFIGKRNYREAADVLGLTEGTVKRRMWECRQLAREQLAKMENREPLTFSRD